MEAHATRVKSTDTDRRHLGATSSACGSTHGGGFACPRKGGGRQEDVWTALMWWCTRQDRAASYPHRCWRFCFAAHPRIHAPRQPRARSPDDLLLRGGEAGVGGQRQTRYPRRLPPSRSPPRPRPQKRAAWPIRRACQWHATGGDGGMLVRCTLRMRFTCVSVVEPCGARSVAGWMWRVARD